MRVRTAMPVRAVMSEQAADGFWHGMARRSVQFG
jgi:hypothetical protein